MRTILLLLAGLLGPVTITFAAEPAKPNIVIILADDLGYGDVQCYNRDKGKIATPNIDRLAAQGMRFTDGHSSSGVCSPSRYTLLTGRYHWRTKLQTGIVGVFEPPLIAPDRVTIASFLKGHGYRTACIGKWHLGWNWPIGAGQGKYLAAPKGDKAVATEEHQKAWREIFSKKIAGGPTTRSFDIYFGTDVPNWPPYCFIDNDRTVGIPTEFLPAEMFKNRQAGMQGPALKGWKLEAILPALGDRAIDFITTSAQAREPFLLYLPLTSPHTPLAVNEPWRGKSGLNRYADFVMETDAVVGRVLEALERSGVADNTLVIFTSDNGCASPNGAAELMRMGHFPSGPLRGFKTDAWEGGHRVPFIARWPGVVKAGSVCPQLVQQADLLATFAEVLGAKLPANAGEDSFSFLPLLKGGDRAIRDHAVNASSKGLPSVRHGAWTLILGPGSGGSSDAGDGKGIQLYNLADDLGQTKNLADAEPKRVSDMKALFEKLISAGRSTPGVAQKNDVAVRRYPLNPAAEKKKKTKATS
jgi:arylsulfatase A